MWLKAFVRMSCTTRKVTMLLMWFMTHCASAVTRIMKPICSRIRRSVVQSTSPGPTIVSTACPVRIGMYSVSTTVTAASRMLSITCPR